MDRVFHQSHYLTLSFSGLLDDAEHNFAVGANEGSDSGRL